MLATRERVDTEGDGTHSAQLIADQLDRILRGATFRQADRLKRFLAFVVKEAIAGRGSALKEYVIGVQVFRKEVGFDPRTDPIVRVQARRLRAKLERYYREEGRGDPLVIDLPRGGYAPTFNAPSTAPLIRRSPAPAVLGRNTVAVHEIEDLSPAGDLVSIAQSVREELIHRLTGVPDLRVLVVSPPPRGDGATDPPGASAAIAIEGSVRRSGERLRIGVRLMDIETRTSLWSTSVDGLIADPFTAQDQAVNALLVKIQEDLHDGRPVGGARRGSENLSAQSFYLQGRYHLNQRTEEGLRRALDFFDKAIAEDARFALAHSGLADAYGLLGHYGVLAPADVWTKAASLAMSALMLDEWSAEAHTSVAHVKATQDWDWAGAELEYRRAISLNPRYATAHHWFAASCLAPLGRLEEALDEMLIARTIDPVSSIVARDLAVVHFYRRDMDAALDQCDHTIELNPHFAPAYWTLGCIQEQRGDLDEATAAFQRAVHLSPQTPRFLGALGRTFALSGRKDQARATLQALNGFSRDRYVSPLEFAWVAFALGDMDDGFSWLAKAFDDRSFDLIAINVDPRFDPCRADPRFKALENRLGLTSHSV